MEVDIEMQRPAGDLITTLGNDKPPPTTFPRFRPTGKLQMIIIDIVSQNVQIYVSIYKNIPLSLSRKEPPLSKRYLYFTSKSVLNLSG